MYISIPDCFIISMFVGLCSGLIYEVLRIIRLLFPFKICVFLCDAAFFIISSKIIMMLSEEMGNYVRLYTVLGFGAGVFTYIVTFGRLLNRAENAVSNAWRKALSKVFNALSKLLSSVFGTISHKIKWIFSQIAEYRNEKKKMPFYDLKSDNEIVYNNKRLEKIGGKTEAIKATVRRNI